MKDRNETVAGDSVGSVLMDFECTLNRLISGDEIASVIQDALAYVLFPGGKRLRPRLALSLCSDLGGRTEELIPAAAALEVVHASSLIHDDLPALDNDDLRRGLPTCHKRFDEGTAILTGDLMVPLAFKSIVSSILSVEAKLKLVQYLSSAYIAVCSGQVMDLSPNRSADQLAKIYEQKTGALFASATAFGAVGAGVSPEVEGRCFELGQQLGIAFQVIDDYLDIFGSDLQRGRPVSSDERNNKVTFFNRSDRKSGLSFLKQTRQRIELSIADIETRTGRKLQLTSAIVTEIFSRAKSSAI